MTKKYHIIATIRDKRGRVLSVGTNSYTKTHPLQAQYALEAGLPHKQFLHAEVDAIKRLRQPWKAHSIMVERYDSNGKPANAMPCVICQRVIDAVGIEVVEFTSSPCS